MAERGIPISEAARAMGASVDSLRKRVQRRSVRAFKGADEEWRVVLPGADDDGTSQSVTEAQRRAGGTDAVQEIVAPFIAELSTVREELGREKERRTQAERERDRLRLEVARLRTSARMVAAAALWWAPVGVSGGCIAPSCAAGRAAARSNR